MRFYLQHGGLGEPMVTEYVEHKHAPMNHHKMGLTYTVSGYGNKIPTEYMVRFESKWRRVYCRVFGNAGTAYIIYQGNEIIVDREG